MDIEESSTDSISFEIKMEVCLVTKEESESSQVSTASSSKCEIFFSIA